MRLRRQSCGWTGRRASGRSCWLTGVGYLSFSDQQLWELIRNGDRVAFEQLYHRYYSPLKSYALSFRYDSDWAEDCIQNLFVKLFTSEALLACQYVRAYLYRSFRNLLLDQLGEKANDVSMDGLEYDILGGR